MANFCNPSAQGKSPTHFQVCERVPQGGHLYLAEIGLLEVSLVISCLPDTGSCALYFGIYSNQADKWCTLPLIIWKGRYAILLTSKNKSLSTIIYNIYTKFEKVYSYICPFWVTYVYGHVNWKQYSLDLALGYYHLFLFPLLKNQEGNVFKHQKD